MNDLAPGTATSLPAETSIALTVNGVRRQMNVAPWTTLLDALRDLHSRRPDARILDIGGWHAPCNYATHLVDIMPLVTLKRGQGYGDCTLRVTENTYHQLDICAEQLPFPDQHFDFVVCRHTL